MYSRKPGPPSARKVKVSPNDFQRWRAMDYDHMLSHPEHLALKTTFGFVSPVSKTTALAWTDRDWERGDPGRREPASRKGGDVVMRGKPVAVGMDAGRRVLVYHV